MRLTGPSGMLGSLSRLFGKCEALLNDVHSHFEVLSWYHPEHIPAQHLALRIQNADQMYYLSFAPKIACARL